MTAAALTAVVAALLGWTYRIRPPARRVGGDDAGGRPDDGHRHRRSRPRRRRHDPAAVAAWCEALARSLRGGETLVGALRATPPPGHLEHELGPLALALDRGVPLDRAADRPTADSDLSVVLAVLRACASVGGSAAEPLDRAAATLRARAADAAERRTHSAQARASALVMTVIPVVMLAVMVGSSDAIRRQVATPAGSAVVALGLCLNLAGWAWMRRTIARTVE